MGLLSATLAKLFWRSDLRGVSWTRLAVAAVLCASVVLVAGLVVLGHDGRMATYAAMVLGVALVLWWLGLRPSRG